MSNRKLIKQTETDLLSYMSMLDSYKVCEFGPYDAGKNKYVNYEFHSINNKDHIAELRRRVKEYILDLSKKNEMIRYRPASMKITQDHGGVTASFKATVYKTSDDFHKRVKAFSPPTDKQLVKTGKKSTGLWSTITNAFR